MKQDYVLGFVFDRTGDYVLLMQKQKPIWQAGKFNGIGGKIEPNESADDAMEREAREEVGLMDALWKQFAIMSGPDFGVFVYATFVSIEELQALKSLETEPISIHATHALPKAEMISNLRWLIPLALDPSPQIVTVFYT